MIDKLWSRIWTAREGLGAIEFAFVAPLLLAILLGIFDFGMAFWQQMEIANAADAGAQWGMSNTYDEASIRTVAQSATNISGTTVTPSPQCGCVNSSTNAITTGYGTPGSCTACPAGSVSSTASTYVVVNAKVCYTTLFPWPGLTFGRDGCSANQVSLTAQSFVLKN